MNNSNPKVSWLISTYNNESEIIRCLTSLLKQTYKNFEIIVVNDGSTDNTVNVLEEIYIKNKNFIRIINNKENMGLAYSLNKAFSHARGIYIARIDADDFAMPN